MMAYKIFGTLLT